MSNEQFDDIAILKTLAQLRSKNLLHPSDQAALVDQLKSSWGRTAAEELLSEGRKVDEQSLSILRRFSSSAF
jgi:hypothetical protein